MTEQELEPMTDDHVKEALKKLINYLYHDERAHYQGMSEEEKSGHIFESVDLLHGWYCDTFADEDEDEDDEANWLVW